MGFLSGVLLWMLGTFATAAVATVFASNVVLLVPGLSGRGMVDGEGQMAADFFVEIVVVKSHGLTRSSPAPGS